MVPLDYCKAAYLDILYTTGSSRPPFRMLVGCDLISNLCTRRFKINVISSLHLIVEANFHVKFSVILNTKTQK